MKVENIGDYAGTVWQLIDTTGSMGLKEIKKGTKLDLSRIYLALGWLAREDKLVFDIIEDDLLVTLIY